MKYTQNTTFTNIPQFKTTNLGVGKSTPFFVTTSYPLKTKKKIVYKLDHDPKEDESWSRHTEEIEEINNPNPIDEGHHAYEGQVDYNAKKKTSKVKYKCSGPDDDYIEVPGGTESITWTDEDGQSYEVDIGDLQEYDGDDGEIEYTKGRNNYPMKLQAKFKQSKNTFNMLMMQQALRSRVYC